MSTDRFSDYLTQFAQARSDFRRAMLENSLARLEAEVQAVEPAISLLEMVNHAQALQVVLESAESAHAFIERVLSGMTEGGVPQVVRQCDGFDQILVEFERASDRTSQLRDLDRMGEPGTKKIPLVIDEHLGLVFQTPKRV